MSSVGSNGLKQLPQDRASKFGSFLRKTYGRGRWRKMKGFATVRLPNGRLRRVELHWYEAHGIGKRDFKIKGYLDET